MGKHCLGTVQSSKYQDPDKANNIRMCRKKYENDSAILTLYNNANATLNNDHKHIVILNDHFSEIRLPFSHFKSLNPKKTEWDVST